MQSSLSSIFYIFPKPTKNFIKSFPITIVILNMAIERIIIMITLTETTMILHKHHAGITIWNHQNLHLPLMMMMLFMMMMMMLIMMMMMMMVLDSIDIWNAASVVHLKCPAMNFSLNSVSSAATNDDEDVFMIILWYFDDVFMTFWCYFVAILMIFWCYFDAFFMIFLWYFSLKLCVQCSYQWWCSCDHKMLINCVLNFQKYQLISKDIYSCQSRGRMAAY